MFFPFTNGQCPECLLKGNREGMMLNYQDFWECPTCHLQAHSASGGMLAILRERGKGDLNASHTLASEHVGGWVLAKDAGLANLKADSSGFKDEIDLKAFLEKEVKKDG